MRGIAPLVIAGVVVLSLGPAAAAPAVTAPPSLVDSLKGQAKEDYRTEQWLCCLDRCDLLTSSYGDLPEAIEALQLAASIRSNPDWMQKACESMSARLGDMYLNLADAWLQKGHKQQAMPTC